MKKPRETNFTFDTSLGTDEFQVDLELGRTREERMTVDQQAHSRPLTPNLSSTSLSGDSNFIMCIVKMYIQCVHTLYIQVCGLLELTTFQLHWNQERCIVYCRRDNRGNPTETTQLPRAMGWERPPFRERETRKKLKTKSERRYLEVV